MPTSDPIAVSTRLRAMRFRTCLSPLALVVVLAAGCGASSGANGGDPDPGADVLIGPDGAVVDTGPPAPDLVKNLSINEVSFFQGTKIVLMKDGAAPTANKTALAAGRAGRLRVYVTPGAAWVSRAVVATLTVTPGGGAAQSFVATQTVAGPSDDADIDSTLNFDVPTASFTMGATWSVVLRTPAGQPEGPTDGASYPADGTADAPAIKDPGAKFNLVLVPMIVSGITPDTSDGAIDAWKNAVYRLYPVTEVNLTVHAPYKYGSSVAATDSGGWSRALQTLLNLRQSEGAADDVFYYGILTPSSSFDAYCSRGCIGGIAPLSNNPSDTYGRGAIGLGWTSDFGFGTIAQELAHSLGRSHAPCNGAPQTDPGFPYKDGSIGVWGWNLTTSALVNPRVKDFMGYCDPPTWTSDYTFGGILTRLAYVAAHANVHYPKDVTHDFQVVSIAENGAMTWGDKVTLATPPLNEPRPLTYYDAGGHVLRTEIGYYYSLDAGGGLLLVPTPEAATRRLVMRDVRGEHMIPR